MENELILNAPLVDRNHLSSRAVEGLFPGFSLPDDRQDGAYSFTGAYLLCAGWMAEPGHEDEVLRPALRDVSNQLRYHNTNLEQHVVAHRPEFPNRHLLLCDLFAQAIRSAENSGRWTLAKRLLDMALSASPKNEARLPHKLEEALAAIAEEVTDEQED